MGVSVIEDINEQKTSPLIIAGIHYPGSLCVQFLLC
jgi:hypothetical protein